MYARLPPYMSMRRVYAWCPLTRLEEGVGYPGTGITEDGQPPYGCWEPNLGPLQEQQVLLTTYFFLYFLR